MLCSTGIPKAVTALVLIFVVTTITVEHVSGAPLISKNDTQDTNLINDATQKSLLLEDGLFEGDIAVTEELIRQHYNFSSIPGGEEYMTQKDENNVTTEAGGEEISKRAAVSGYYSRYQLWTNGTVPYQFSSSIRTNWRHKIREAMDHWKDHTCLRFTLRNGEKNYVEYNNEMRTCSSHVGMHGGKQTINMDSHRVCTWGTIVHEIGHAVGFWHEQSRPDRDNYIQINYINIENRRWHNFIKRTNREVDSRGSEYDYGSVMHYEETKFARCSGCQSFQVTNLTAYRAQGSPKIGDWTTGLSTRDVEQAKRLYSCPKRGTRGRFVFFIGNGQSLPDTDPIWNAPDPYVKITAVDSAGIHYIRKTSVKSGTTNPAWNQYLRLPGREWQFFRMQVWDDDNFLLGGDDKMTVSETILITPGNHYNRRHCSNDACNDYVSYNYDFVLDGNECNPNPCLNGGTCVDGISSYTCRCRPSYSGTNCGWLSGNFRVYARFGRNLQDKDGWWNNSDPYLEVIAIDANGNSLRKRTSTKSGDQSPDWNEWLNFGTRAWRYFKVRVYDDDNNADDALSNRVTWTISSHVSRTYVRLNCYRGYVVFDYFFN